MMSTELQSNEMPAAPETPVPELVEVPVEGVVVIEEVVATAEPKRPARKATRKTASKKSATKKTAAKKGAAKKATKKTAAKKGAAKKATKKAGAKKSTRTTRR